MNESCDDERVAAREPGVYLLQLSISFEQGLGTTRAVSREQVRFTTRACVGKGQYLQGFIHFPAGTDAVGSVLRYVARVSSVQSPQINGSSIFEVTAQFEQLAFVLGDAA
jgi:hypothetical protein